MSNYRNIVVFPDKLWAPRHIAWLVAMAIGLHLAAGLVWASSDLTEAQLVKLQRGEVIVAVKQAQNRSTGAVEATILIDASAEQIWQVMTDCGEIPTYVPGVEDCQVLSSGDNWEIIRHDVKWTWFVPQLSYVFLARYQPNQHIEFNRIEGDLRDMQGSWRLTPASSNQTLVCYRVYLDPGFWIPQWLVRQSLKADLPAVLTALRSKVIDHQSRSAIIDGAK